MKEDTVELFRPVGPSELKLIEDSDFSEFPPRLEWQPIFYPVLTLEYAEKIAREWNVKASGYGAVLRFKVRSGFIGAYEPKVVGGAAHREYWIPAEALEDLNRNIVGRIEIVAEYGDR